MQFKHPELLYALLLLLIPIIIHLFQLRRFKKTAFTNVAFLKKVTLQTRKSSQLKKWLILLTRMLAIACLVLAFAQPFIASEKALDNNKETVVYLDNSHSMQAKGAEGSLLERAKQDLYSYVDTENVSWFTNTDSYKNSSLKNFREDVLATDYTANQLTPKQVLLKAEQLFSNDPSANKRLLYISDFQLKESFPPLSNNIELDLVPLKPTKATNIAIDTAYISSQEGRNLQLTSKISAQGNPTNQVAVSLYNDKNLVAKTSVDFSESNTQAITFDIKADSLVKGKLQLNDASLSYDNQLFFSVNTPKKIKVLSINEASGTYLKKLFDDEAFQYTTLTHNNLDYNTIPQQNFIILNGLKNIPAPLVAALSSFEKNGGSLLIIPNATSNIDSYNHLLTSLSLGTFNEQVNSEKRITSIIFDHPLYRNVFEKRIINFQFPKITTYYTLLTSSNSILQYEDKTPFITQQGNNYLATAPFDVESSNFTNSPLIVPTLLNMAQASLPLPSLYYTTGTSNTFAIPIKLQQDEIVKLKDSTSTFIPLQQTKANKVEITTQDQPDTAGTWGVYLKDQFLEDTSFNEPRAESVLQYANANDWEGAQVYSSITSLLNAIEKENTIYDYWKWFALAAFLFLVIELLILKFVKK